MCGGEGFILELLMGTRDSGFIKLMDSTQFFYYIFCLLCTDFPYFDEVCLDEDMKSC